MTVIRGSHDLMEQPADSQGGSSRSRYRYLFPDLADEPEAGLFPGTDEAGTIRRLKTFVEAFDRPFLAPPHRALSMRLPAAYTYFGQFLNHDISAPVGGLRVDLAAVPPAGIIGTSDPAGLGKTARGNVADILEHFANEHPAPMTLGSLYGEGPDSPGSAALYQEDGLRFRLGCTDRAPPQVFSNLKIPPGTVEHVTDAPDILRENRVPLMADLRNDGNLILSQLHLAFLLVHNAAVDAVERQDPAGKGIFARARQLVTRHYHWLILNDYLPGILSRTALARPLADWPALRGEPGTVPMEFTTAAFRFGHSMVADSYDFNANFGRGGRISPQGATLADLFEFTSQGNMGDPEGRRWQVPDHWVIDWDRMTRGPVPGEDLPGGAEQIDLSFAPDMLNVAGNATVAEHGSILFRNLLRGFHRRMPFGQRLAGACGVAPLPRAGILAALRQPGKGGATSADVAGVADELGLVEHTPAWLYFLCEAKALEGGERVGPTASRIIAETIVGLMRAANSPVLKQGAGRWHPRDSPLRDAAGQPLETLRAFLMFADALVRSGARTSFR